MIFSLIFIVVGSFLTLNLFVTIIVDTFNELKKELELRGKSGVQVSSHYES